MFKLQKQDAKGIWSDVTGTDGKRLTFADEAAARAQLAAMFPVEVGLESYAGPKTVRVVVADPYADVDEEKERDWQPKG